MLLKRILIAVTAILQVGDVITTNRFLSLGGQEGNPVIAWIQATMGDAWVIPKLLIMVVVILVVSQAKTAKPAMFLAGMSLLTVANNALLISDLSH